MILVPLSGQCDHETLRRILDLPDGRECVEQYNAMIREDPWSVVGAGSMLQVMLDRHGMPASTDADVPKSAPVLPPGSDE